jgi:hypothetical protein
VKLSTSEKGGELSTVITYGTFDYLNDYCKVVYLPRTESVSSTEIKQHIADGKRTQIAASL